MMTMIKRMSNGEVLRMFMYVRMPPPPPPPPNTHTHKHTVKIRVVTCSSAFLTIKEHQDS